MSEKKASITFIFKKGRRDDLKASFTSDPRKTIK